MKPVMCVALVLGLLAACSEAPPPTSDAAGETPTPTVAYGAWPSPISAESLVQGARGIFGVRREGETFYWLESRPQQGGRITIMTWQEGQEPIEVLPEPWNARTRVQEYGGGAVLVTGGVIYFSNYKDQRLYRLTPGQEPVAVTPSAPLRFAGCAADQARERLICIREDHRAEGEPVNTLVAIDLAGAEPDAGSVIFSGTDFVSAPRISADGSRIAFTTWMHPNMPWDSTQLHSAVFGQDGHLVNVTLHNPEMDESILDPQWLDDNTLVAISDRNNWWQPYRVVGDSFEPILKDFSGMEIGGPDWGINTRYYFPQDSGAIYAIARTGSVEQLLHIDEQGKSEVVSTGVLNNGAVSFGNIIRTHKALYFTAGFSNQPSMLVKTNLSGGELEAVRKTRDSALAPQWIPEFQQVTFPLASGGEAHGVYLPPTNPDVTAPADDAPPLIVSVHGGPTSVAGVTYKPSHYYWTSRGFAVLDLNYRGSTGFGRDYRRALYGQWGIADVQDAVEGAQWLAQQGLADPEKLIIRGGSAGGYTTLAVHAFHDTFAAGASYYGVSDIEALAAETHKFESRYLDQLIGPYPERKDLYIARSPIHNLDGFNAPLILLQGLEDPIVPPNQSEMIYDALKANGVPTAYIAYEGEPHGFRKAENQIHSLQAELYFYAQVLGFELAEDLPSITIENSPGGQ